MGRECTRSPRQGLSARPHEVLANSAVWLATSDTRRTRLVVVAVGFPSPLLAAAEAALDLAADELPLRDGASLPGPERFL